MYKKQCIKDGNGVFCLDATGSIVKKVHKNADIYYYAMVVKSPDKTLLTVPVLEFLSESHGTYVVVRPMLSFIASLQKTTKYCQPKRIECDFSWALIHSVLLAFGKTSIDKINTLMTNTYGFLKRNTTVHIHLPHRTFLKHLLSPSRFCWNRKFCFLFFQALMK